MMVIAAALFVFAATPLAAQTTTLARTRVWVQYSGQDPAGVHLADRFRDHLLRSADVVVVSRRDETDVILDVRSRPRGCGPDDRSTILVLTVYTRRRHFLDYDLAVVDQAGVEKAAERMVREFLPRVLKTAPLDEVR